MLVANDIRWKYESIERNWYQIEMWIYRKKWGALQIININIDVCMKRHEETLNA